MSGIIVSFPDVQKGKERLVTIYVQHLLIFLTYFYLVPRPNMVNGDITQKEIV